MNPNNFIVSKYKVDKTPLRNDCLLFLVAYLLDNSLLLSVHHMIEERNTKELIHLTQQGTSTEIVKFKGVLKTGLTKIRNIYLKTVVIVSDRTIL